MIFQETLDFFVLALSKPLDVLYLAYVLNFLALKPYILIYFVLIKNVYSILLKHFVDASQEPQINCPKQFSFSIIWIISNRRYKKYQSSKTNHDFIHTRKITVIIMGSVLHLINKS